MIRIRSVRLSAVCLFVSILPMAGWGVVSLAQTPEMGSQSSQGVNVPLELLRAGKERPSLSTTIPLEGPLDEETYIVGPGDIFSISQAGFESFVDQTPVHPDGNVLVPEIGRVYVAGLTLAAAVEQLRTALKEAFRNVRVDVSLAVPRTFYVHVGGQVDFPGRHATDPVDRLTDVLEDAINDEPDYTTEDVELRRLLEIPEDFQPSLRNVIVKRRDGSIVRADLMRYFTTGEPANNPYLLDGDVINVPAYNYKSESVYVGGDVAHKGSFDHRPDDTIASVIEVATGRPVSETTSVRIMRTLDSGEPVVLNYPPPGATNGRWLDDPVSKGDHVHVVPSAAPPGLVTIEGQVQYPGQYAVQEGRTSVRQLIDMAGGVTPDASTRLAYLERRDLKRERDVPEWLRMYPSTRLADIDLANRAFLVTELKVQAKVSLDLDDEQLISSTMIRDGDNLFVPRDNQTVLVIGSVKRPGQVSYMPGMAAGHYVRAAGGIEAEAGKTYAINVATGEYVDGAVAEVFSGDVVFVERIGEYASSVELEQLQMEKQRQAREGRFRIAQTILGTVSAAATIAAIIVATGN